jgi:hypothetical protein
MLIFYQLSRIIGAITFSQAALSTMTIGTARIYVTIYVQYVYNILQIAIYAECLCAKL